MTGLIGKLDGVSIGDIIKLTAFHYNEEVVGYVFKLAKEEIKLSRYNPLIANEYEPVLGKKTYLLSDMKEFEILKKAKKE